MEISSVRANVSYNRYSDEEYDSLQRQCYSLQKTISELRSKTSEKDLEISQLEARLELVTKSEANLKRRLQEETEQLEKDLQNALAKERDLRLRLSRTELESMQHSESSKELQEKDWGLHLYTAEVDRLNGVVQELQEEMASLRLKLSSMNNQ